VEGRGCGEGVENERDGVVEEEGRGDVCAVNYRREGSREWESREEEPSTVDPR
jgi:hypothetical protein